MARKQWIHFFLRVFLLLIMSGLVLTNLFLWILFIYIAILTSLYLIIYVFCRFFKFVTARNSYRFGTRSAKAKRKTKPGTPSNCSRTAGLILMIAIFICLIYSTLTNMPYRRVVEHGATWSYLSDDNREVYLRYRSGNCNAQAVLFELEAYDHSEIICSQAILDYLETIDDESVRLVYRITRDMMGKTPFYQLLEVGSISIAPKDWLVGYWISTNCRCPYVRHSSPLVTSTWR